VFQNPSFVSLQSASVIASHTGVARIRAGQDRKEWYGMIYNDAVDRLANDVFIVDSSTEAYARFLSHTTLSLDKLMVLRDLHQPVENEEESGVYAYLHRKHPGLEDFGKGHSFESLYC
jgi:acyl-homoserine lactone acylase PvdQ